MSKVAIKYSCTPEELDEELWGDPTLGGGQSHCWSTGSIFVDEDEIHDDYVECPECGLLATFRLMTPLERLAEEGGSRRVGSVTILRRAGVYPVEELLETAGCGSKKLVELAGVEVEVGNLRLRCFAEHGTTCVACGVQATHFAVEWVSSKNYVGWALNLYGPDELFFTKDHTYPRSKGGPDTLENLKPMCWPCNQQKGSSVPDEQVPEAS